MVSLLGLAALKVPVLADPTLQANIVGTLMPVIIAATVYLVPNKPEPGKAPSA